MLVCTHNADLELSGAIWTYLPGAIWSYLECGHRQIVLNSDLRTYAILYYTYYTILYLLIEFIPYARLHTQMPIWSHLELSGAI